MPPHGKGLPPFKSVRCKFFNADGTTISPGCSRSAALCHFVHPEDREWKSAEKRTEGALTHARGRRYSTNNRSGRLHSRSRSRSMTRSPSPAHRSRLPGPSRRRSPSPVGRRRRSRTPPGSHYTPSDSRFPRRDASPERYRDRGHGHQSPTRSARASSPSHSSARATSPPTPRARAAVAGPSRVPMSPGQVPSPRERTTSAKSDAMAVDSAPAAPAALRPALPSRASASVGEMMPPPPPPNSMPPPPPPAFPPFAPNLFKLPPPPVQMVDGREMTDTEMIKVWGNRIALAADALSLRRESNKLLEDIQQAEALSTISPAAASAAERLSQQKSQKDAELLKKIDRLNREHFWPIAKDVDVEKFQKEHEGLGAKAEQVQAKLAEFSELLRDVMRREASLRGGGETDGSGRARKRRRIDDEEDGEVGSDDEETARESAAIIEAEKHLEELYTDIRVQLEDVKEAVVQEARDAQEEVLAKIDDSVAEILAHFTNEAGGEDGENVFRAEPGPLAMARLDREEARHKALEDDLAVLKEEHQELIRLKDAKIAEQEAEIAQLRALLDEVTLSYERDKQETDALANASNAHAAALQQRLKNPPPTAPIPDATTILDSLPTPLDEMVMAKLHPLMLKAHESTRSTLEAHSKSVQEKVLSTVIEGARVAHVLVNYLNAKDHAGLQAVLESMASQPQDGPRNGLRPMQPPPPPSRQASDSASMPPPPRPISSISVPQKMPPTQQLNGWPPSVGHQVPVPPGPQHQYTQWTNGVGAPPSSGQSQTSATRANQTAYSQANFLQGHASLMERMQAVRREASASASPSPGATTATVPAHDSFRSLDMDVDPPSASVSTTLPASGSHTPHLDSAPSTAPPLTNANANVSSSTTVENTANAPPPMGALPTYTSSDIPLASSSSTRTTTSPSTAPSHRQPQPPQIATQHSRSKSVSPPPSPPSAIEPQSSFSARGPDPDPTKPVPAPNMASTSASGPSSAKQTQQGSALTPASGSGNAPAQKTAEVRPSPTTNPAPRAAQPSTSQPVSAPATVQSFVSAWQPPPIDTAVPAVAAAYSARRASAGGLDSDQSRLLQQQQQPPASVPLDADRDRARSQAKVVKRPVVSPTADRKDRPRQLSGPGRSRISEGDRHYVPDRMRRKSGPGSTEREQAYTREVQTTEVLPPLRLGDNGFVPDARRVNSPVSNTVPQSAGLPSRPREKSPPPERGREAGPSRYRRRDAYSASPNWD